MARHPAQRTTRVTRRERAALVGLIAGHARRLEAERSLDELAGLAEAAGAERVRHRRRRRTHEQRGLEGHREVLDRAAREPLGVV